MICCLDADAVHGLDIALLPSVRNALMNGNLRGALDAIATTNQIDSIREIAAKLGAVIGDTQIRVVDNSITDNRAQQRRNV